MFITRLIFNTVRKHKGIALVALLYYLYSLGKKTSGVNHRRPTARHAPARKR